MSEANKTRGEVALTLDGAEYVLRPSYEAIAAFEEATGKGLVDLAMAASRAELTTKQAAIIAAECIRAYGRERNITSRQGASADKIGRMMMEAEGGVAEALIIIGGLLSLAATGGVKASGEVKAATTEATETSAAA